MKPGVNKTYDFLFGILKTMEGSELNHSFSAHGKTQALRFNLIAQPQHRNQPINIGYLEFSPTTTVPGGLEFEPLDMDYVRARAEGIGKSGISHKIYRSSMEAYAVVLGGLIGAVDVWGHGFDNRPSCAEAWFRGVLKDDTGAQLGYIMLQFDMPYQSARIGTL